MGVYVLLSVLILITCILLALIVLVQNAKGGGLASNFSSSNQVMGVRKTTDFLEKATWTLAIVLLMLTLSTTFVIPRTGERRAAQSEIFDRLSVDEFDPADFQRPSEPQGTEGREEVLQMPGSENIED